MCGSATHPGGGIMGAPGRIAALEYLKEKKQRAAGGLMATRIDAIVIGAGHNGLVAAAYLAKAQQEGRRCWSGAERVGGILRGPELGAGVPRAGHRRTPSAGCGLRGRGPEARPARVRADRRRTCACTPRMPDGSAVTFWADADAHRRGAPRPQRRTTPTRSPASTRRSARSASFLAYVQVATPARPEVALARRRDHGAEAGQGVPRPRRQDRPGVDPGAADGGRGPRRRRCSRTEAVRGPLADARRAVHGDGRVGHRAPRRCSCTTRPATTAARPGQRCSRGAAPARWPTRSRRRPRRFGVQIRTGAEVVDDPHARTAAPSASALADGDRDRRAARGLGRRSEADARGCSTRSPSGRRPGVARREHPSARRDGTKSTSPSRRPAGVRRRRRGAAARAGS